LDYFKYGALISQSTTLILPRSDIHIDTKRSLPRIAYVTSTVRSDATHPLCSDNSGLNHDLIISQADATLKLTSFHQIVLK
jgi:hypothetical protein